jgi:XTP/dITP diphosphohydrolase
MTAAQLTPEQKNLLSHRGKALRELISQLQDRAK